MNPAAVTTDWTLLSLLLSSLGMLGGVLSYVLNLRIKRDILENNEKVKKEFIAKIDALRKELIDVMVKDEEKINRLDHTATEFAASNAERILTVINGKYVRTDLHQSEMSSIQEKFALIKELIETNMSKIERGLDRQITDLKERLLGDKL